MLQVFHLDIVKVNLHVAYVSKCFRCLIRMLQAFHLDVAYVCNGYTRVFQVFSNVLQVFQTYVASVFIWMLQKYIWCCTCCNRTHAYRSRLFAAAGAPPSRPDGLACMCMGSGWGTSGPCLRSRGAGLSVGAVLFDGSVSDRTS
jgi:hypothetical protein